MKKALLIIAALASLNLTACKETDSALNQANNEKMKDSVFRTHPAIRYMSIEIEDNQDVTIVCGSKALYNGTDAERQAVTDELAQITYHFHNEHNYLGKGKVLFAEKETEIPADSDPKKECDMKLEEIVKQHEK